MKFKPLYMYLALIVILLTLLFIFTKNNSSESSLENSEQQMPNDDIHKGLKNGEAPGRGNVSAEILHKMEELKKAAEENPNDTLRLREYADFLSEAHKSDDAVKYYEKILKVNPKRADILLSLSFIYYNKQNYDKSEEITKRILSFDKNNPLALYNLGAIAATKGDHKKAREFWNLLIKEQPNSEAAKAAEQSLSNLKD